MNKKRNSADAEMNAGISGSPKGLKICLMDEFLAYFTFSEPDYLVMVVTKRYCEVLMK